VADGSQEAAQKRAASLGSIKAYADYREMLHAERPQLVCVAPRHTDQHLAMISAALEAGAHVYAEKPFVSFPAEADALLALAAKPQRWIAVQHNYRLVPQLRRLAEMNRRRELGEIIAITCWGKQDQRAGGEDMMVLGTHLFDYLRCLLGTDPLWCQARVLDQGQPITAQGARLVKDNVGPVAGDDVVAHFGFPGGVVATFHSSQRLRQSLGSWGLEIRTTTGVYLARMDGPPHVFTRQRSAPAPTKDFTDAWTPLPHPTDEELAVTPFKDWLSAVEQNREPLCSAANAAWAVEMVMAVYHAALSGKQVPFPLKDRGHPLRLDNR
jgi:predicted dehydrogenase